jgi:hypothetical protein
MPVPLTRRVSALLGMLAIVAAGCGAAATPTPAPTPAPTPTAAPTPTPVDIAAAFLAEVTATSGRLPVTGTATFGGTEAALTGLFESSGADDSASTMTLDIGGSTQTTESIRIGTQKWSRQDGGVWILDPEPADSTKSLGAWLRGLTMLEDEGVETKDGRQLHHLVPSAAEALTPEAMGLDPSIQDAVITVDFWAEDDGTPAIMSITVTWNQASGTTTVPVEMTMDVDLGGLGQPAAIAPPEEAWTGFTSTRFGYSMAYAPGWSAREDNGMDVYLMDDTPYFYVTPQDLAPGYTLERFRDELVAYYQAEDIKASPDADEEYQVGGIPARVLTYRFTNTSGTPVYLVDAVTVQGTTGWEIYLAQEQTGEEEARAFFDTMLATFSFEE